MVLDSGSLLLVKTLGVPLDADFSRIGVVWLRCFHHSNHSALDEPRGTSTVRNAPGVRDITTWSVIP